MVLSKEDLIKQLRDMITHIEQSDSFEGNLTYSCLNDHTYINEFEVQLAYRVGNLEGQGGMHMILESSPESIDERARHININNTYK